MTDGRLRWWSGIDVEVVAGGGGGCTAAAAVADGSCSCCCDDVAGRFGGDEAGLGTPCSCDTAIAVACEKERVKKSLVCDSRSSRSNF